jgi:ankyrin repeat protein
VIRLLLRRARHSRNGHLVFHATQRTNLSEATRLIRLLYQYGKPVDEILYQDERSYNFRAQFLRGTPLYYACKNGRLPVALTLLDLGADPDKACVRYNEHVGPSSREVVADYGWSIFETPDGVKLPQDT